MKPTIKKVQPVKVVAPFLNSQSESPVTYRPRESFRFVLP